MTAPHASSSGRAYPPATARPATAGPRAYLAAEAVRLRRTFVGRMPLVGLAWGALTGVLATAAAGTGAQQALAWQILWVTGIAGPVMALFGALPEARERAARDGGLPARGVRAKPQRVARLLWLSVLSAGFQLAVYVPLVALNSVPVYRAAWAAAMSWCGSLALLGIGGMVGRLVGTVPAVGAGLAWQILGGVCTERDWWWTVPPAWPIRPMLVPLGVRFNGVPMPADYPALADPTWLGWVLNLAWAAVVAVGYVAVGRPRLRRHGLQRRGSQRPRLWRRRPGRAGTDAASESGPLAGAAAVDELSVAAVSSFDPRSAGPARTPGSRRRPARLPLAATILLNRGSGLGWCIAAAVAVLAFAAWRYPPEVVSGLYSYLVLPIGAGMAPVLLWRVAAPGHAQAQAENPRAADALQAALCALVTVVGLVAFGCYLAAAGSGQVPAAPGAGARLVLWIFSGCVLVQAGLALVVRAGVGTVLAVTLALAVVSVTVGGDVLAQSPLWVLAFPAYAESAGTPARIAVALAVQAACAAAAWFAARRGLRRPAAPHRPISTR